MEKLPHQIHANMPKISTSHSTPASTTVPLKAKHKITPNPFPHYSHKLQASKQLAGKEEKTNRKQMASTSAVSMAMPLTQASQKRVVPSSEAFFKPLPLLSSKAVAASKPNGRFQVRASMKEKVVTGLTAAAMTASMMVPDVAEAAVSPSLKNFLLSIAAGGVVLTVIVGAVVGVSNFDPVKRS